MKNINLVFFVLVLLFADSLQGMTDQETAQKNLEQSYDSFIKLPNSGRYVNYLKAYKNVSDKTPEMEMNHKNVRIIAYQKNIFPAVIEEQLKKDWGEVEKKYKTKLDAFAKNPSQKTYQGYPKLLAEYIEKLGDLTVLQGVRDQIIEYYIPLIKFFGESNKLDEALKINLDTKKLLEAWNTKYRDQKLVSDDVMQNVEKVRSNITNFKKLIINEAQEYLNEMKDNNSELLQVLEAQEKLSDLLNSIKDIDKDARELLLDAQFAYDNALIKEYGKKDLGTLRAILATATNWQTYIKTYKVSETLSKKLDAHKKVIQEDIKKVTPKTVANPQTSRTRTTVPRRIIEFSKQKSESLQQTLQKLQNALTNLNTQLTVAKP